MYTFSIKNYSVKDSRVVGHENLVPAFLIIFFPTSFDALIAKAREKVREDIDSWVSQFTDVDQISKKDLANLSRIIEESLIKSQTSFKLSEIEEANVVIGKSIKLLYNVAKYSEKETDILIYGTDKVMTKIIGKTVLESNSEIVKFFEREKDVTKLKLSNINVTAVQRDSLSFNISKYLNDNLTGILYFVNFSNNKEREIRINDLETLIKKTKNDCIISFAMSQSRGKINISETRIPEILKTALGRTISLLDLSQEKMTLGIALLEFLDKITEKVKKEMS